MNKPEKSFENPILFDDGIDEEALLKGKQFKSLQRKSLPEIDNADSKLFSDPVESASLPDIDDEPALPSLSDVEEDFDDGLDLVDQLLEEFNNENIGDNDSSEQEQTLDDSDDEDDDDIILEDDDDDEDEIFVFDDDDEDNEQTHDSDEGVADIDPEILKFLEEVNLETNDETEDWFIDDIQADDGENTEEFTFSPIEDNEELSADELFEQFTTVEPEDDSEDTSLEEGNNGDTLEEEPKGQKITDKLKTKLTEMKDSIKSEIGDGNKSKANAQESEDSSDENTGLLAKVNGFFLNILLKLTGLLAKLPVVGRFFEPTEKLMTILGRIAVFAPLILLIVLLLFVNNIAVNKTEVHDLPDQGQVKVQNVDYDKDNNTIEAELVNTGDIIGEARADFSVRSTQLSLNPIHWFIPQEVTTCSSDWVTVDLDDIETVTASCEDEELAGFWFRGSIEVVE